MPTIRCLIRGSLSKPRQNEARDQANLASAQRDRARYAALLPARLTTRQQYDTQKNCSS